MKMSDSTKNIFKALSDFRKEVLQPKKDADNPQFRSKYVPLESVRATVDSVAPKHGLADVQNLTTREHEVGVQTMLTHESGEYILFDWLFLDARPVIRGGSKGEVTAQSQGSAITYGKRYTLSSAYGIASEVDDDGNAATGDIQQTQPTQQKQKTPPKAKKITKAEALEIAKGLKKSIAELKEMPEKSIDEWLIKYMDVKTIAEITDWDKAVAYLTTMESRAKEQAGG